MAEEGARAVILYDEEGTTIPCLSTIAQHEHWKRHFITVLVVTSMFNESELGLVRQRHNSYPGAVPGHEDVEIALDKLKNSKAAGSLGPEMLNVGRKCEGLWIRLQFL